MPKPDFTSAQNKYNEIIRVNHAGEYGAKRIYEGQIKFLRNSKDKELINSMLEHELVHLNYFDNELRARRIPATLFMPLWNFGGFAIGAISACLGLRTAMLVTEAVEEVIEKHYSDQLNYLKDTPYDSELFEKIKEFRQDELNHHEIALENDSDKAFLSRPLAKLVNKICRTAIFMSKKI